MRPKNVNQRQTFLNHVRQSHVITSQTVQVSSNCPQISLRIRDCSKQEMKCLRDKRNQRRERLVLAWSAWRSASRAFTPKYVSCKVLISLDSPWKSFTNQFDPGARFSTTVCITPNKWFIFPSTVLVTVTYGFKSVTEVIDQHDYDTVAVTSLILRNTTFCLTG